MLYVIRCNLEIDQELSVIKNYEEISCILSTSNAFAQFFIKLNFGMLVLKYTTLMYNLLY